MQRLLARIRQYLQQHWRGEHALLTAVVLNVAIPVVGLAWLGQTAAGSRLQPSLQSASVKTALLSLIAVVIAAVLLVGAIAVNRQRRVQHGHSGTGAEILVSNAVLIGIAVHAMVVSIDQWTAATASQVNKEFLADVKQPFVELSLQLDPADPTRVLLDGEISITASRQFAAFAAQHPQLQQVELNSIGGNVFAARGIAGHIERLQLSTHVESRCFSSCTLLFAGGTQRTASNDARFGFHQYRYDTRYSETLPAVAPELDQDAGYLQRRGVDIEFLRRVAVIPATELWSPSLQALIDAGFLHVVVVNPVARP